MRVPSLAAEPRTRAPFGEATQTARFLPKAMQLCCGSPSRAACAARRWRTTWNDACHVSIAKAYGVFTFCNGPSHGLEGKVCPTRSYLRARLRGHLPSRAALAADPFHGRLASHGTIALLQC